jgi:peptide/nickel transport system substrate-binding protein
MSKVPPDGQVNFGQWSNKRFDELLNYLKGEPDPKRREAAYREAITIARDDMADIRLYHQMIIWAMRKNVDAPIRSDNFVNLKWITKR